MARRPLFPIVIIAAIVLAGLVVGLTGESFEDVAANFALTVCLVPILWALHRR